MRRTRAQAAMEEGAPARKRKTEGGLSSRWTRVDSTLLVLDADVENKSSRVVAFDLDDTLVTTRSGRVFPTGRSDWRWLYDEVRPKLSELHSQGVKLAIFTNQSGMAHDDTKVTSICGKIEDVLEELGVPMQVFVATDDDKYRKPSTEMWDLMASRYNGGEALELGECKYVGDAAGRAAGRGRKKKDFSCSDRKFAHNCGVGFETPEEFFRGEEHEEFDWDSPDLDALPKSGDLCEGGVESLTAKGQEMVVCVGLPASGKSTMSQRYLVPAGYVRVNRDTLKTPAKCLKATEEALEAGKSVVIDNTNPSAAARALYVAMARERQVPVRCFWFQADLQLAQHLSHFRERITGGEVAHIPRVAYGTYNKQFQEPALAEGFTEIKRINFVADHFESPEAQKSFFQMS